MKMIATIALLLAITFLPMRGIWAGDKLNDLKSYVVSGINNDINSFKSTVGKGVEKFAGHEAGSIVKTGTWSNVFKSSSAQATATKIIASTAVGVGQSFVSGASSVLNTTVEGVHNAADLLRYGETKKMRADFIRRFNADPAGALKAEKESILGRISSTNSVVSDTFIAGVKNSVYLLLYGETEKVHLKKELDAINSDYNMMGQEFKRIPESKRAMVEEFVFNHRKYNKMDKSNWSNESKAMFQQASDILNKTTYVKTKRY